MHVCIYNMCIYVELQVVIIFYTKFKSMERSFYLTAFQVCAHYRRAFLQAALAIKILKFFKTI